MKTETLNDSLIEAIKTRIPKGINITTVLSNILYMGKEAVYRRLRGEVPFTFTEASLISQTLGVSLDKLTTYNSASNALFKLNFVHYNDLLNTYYKQIERNIQFFNYVKDSPSVEWYTASNILPQVFNLDFEYLSRFLLFKWIYQHLKANDIKSFSEFQLSTKLGNIQKQYVAASKKVTYTCFIWDKMIFQHLINDILYFQRIYLISEKEVQLLKEDIYTLLDDLENLAIKGTHKNGNKIQMYLSDINFEATYSYLETINFRTSFIRVFSINWISTFDEEMFNNQKDWIHSLKRYSTLISESGEMQRLRFFEEQRKYVSELL